MYTSVEVYLSLYVQETGHIGEQVVIQKYPK